MNKTVKIIITAVIVAAILGGIYLFTKRDAKHDMQDTETGITTTTENVTASDVATASPIVVTQKPTATQNAAPEVSQPATPAALTYKGEFFPFEFIYPHGFREVKNPQPSTKDSETKTFSFNRLSFDGSFGGYLSIYVNKADSDKYDELLKTEPQNYSTTQINGQKFYVYEAAENNGYKMEYITFKNDVRYRFSLIVANDEKKKLDSEVYKPDTDTLEIIVKSLKIY